MHSNIENSNEWIENAISKKYIKHFEYERFYNLQDVGSGSYGKICRANWKNFNESFVLKTFYDLNNITLNEIVREIKLRFKVGTNNENIIKFYGITKCDSKNFMLVMEYADSGTLQNYLKENFERLTWNEKFDLAFQLAYAVSCLHDEEIIHGDLHSGNILVHQNTLKLADLGLKKRIEEASNFQSFGTIPYIDPKSFARKKNEQNQIQIYSLNQKSDVYSVGVLMWEISSGRLPFDGKEQYDISLVNEILKGRRESPVPDTPEDFIKIYIDCWDIEPDNRPNINQVISGIINIQNEISNDDVNMNEIPDENNIKVNEISKDDDSIMNEISNDEDIEMNEISNNSDIIMNEISNDDDVEMNEIPNDDDVEMTDVNYDMDDDEFAIVDTIIDILSKVKENDEKQEIIKYLNNRKITIQKIHNFILSNQTHSNSIVLLGKFNYLGIEMKVNEQKAYELYQKAAELGNVSGMNDLAHCYENGIGVSENKQKAFELYQEAAIRGSASGKNNLGYCYDNGIGTSIDKKKAFQLYEEAKTIGHSIAHFNVGLCYEEGNGVDKDHNMAFKLYQELTEEKFPDGIERLGYCYQNGIGVSIDHRKAFELYKEAETLGSISGKTMLATCYYKGIGTRVNKKKALKLYEEAANSGYSVAQYDLACIYDRGEGVSQDCKKAFELFKKSAESEYPDAMCYLAHYYQSGIETNVNNEEAFKLYQKAAELGNLVAQYKLACIYDSGEGVNQDCKKAFELFKKSAESECSEAMCCLAYYYQSGIETDVDKEKAFKLYQKAAELGNLVARDNLATMYEKESRNH